MSTDDGGVNAFGDVVDVAGSQAAHVDAAAFHQVDVVLGDELLHLAICEITCQVSALRERFERAGLPFSPVKENMPI